MHGERKLLLFQCAILFLRKRHIPKIAQPCRGKSKDFTKVNTTDGKLKCSCVYLISMLDCYFLNRHRESHKVSKT